MLDYIFKFVLALTNLNLQLLFRKSIAELMLSVLLLFIVLFSPAACENAIGSPLRSQENVSKPTSVPETTVGMTGRMVDLKFGGAELLAKPLNEKDAVVVRIADVQPHGELRRYTIEYWGMEPGIFDLRDFLLRTDKSTTNDLPPLPIQVNSVTVVENGQLNDLEKTNIPWVGGYRILVALGALAWITIAICIFTLGRKPKSGSKKQLESEKTVTWADKLRPLIQKSQDGELNPQEQASLERLLVAFWREKLSLNNVPANDALDRIKSDPEAGQLLNQLELWLHSPNPDRNVDIQKLLLPYQQEVDRQNAI